MFKDSSEIGMKPRLAQALSDYYPSAPSFSAIRTKSARKEAALGKDFRLLLRDWVGLVFMTRRHRHLRVE